MSRRYLLLLCGAMLIFVSACSRRSEVVVSEGTVLNDAWIHLSPRDSIASTAPVSELFIEFPETVQWSDKELAGGKNHINIEGYLETRDGAQIVLVPSSIELGQTAVLEMTNPVLEWSKNDLRIKSIVLRSSVPVKTEKIIWVSDDPRHHKDGLILPEKR